MSSFGGDPQVKTIFTADATSAKKGAKEAADAVQKSAEDQQSSLSKIGKATAFIQAAIGRIFIPLAIASGIVRIANAWLKVQQEAAAAQAQIDKTRQSLIDLSRQDVFGLRKGNELEEALKKGGKEIRDTAKAQVELNKKRQEELKLLSIKDKALFKASTGRSTEEEIAALEKQNEQIYKDSVKAQADLEKRIRADYAENRRQEEAKAESQEYGDSLQRAEEFNKQAEDKKIEALEGEARAIAEFDKEQRERDLALMIAKTEEEADAINNVSIAAAKALEAELTKIRKEGEKERTEATKAAVAEQAAAYEELRSIIDSAYQAQQQFSQSLTSGLGADITRIADALSLYGGWKK